MDIRVWQPSFGFSPDGNLLAGGSYDHTVSLWQMEAIRGRLLTEVAPLEVKQADNTLHEEGRILSLAFSPDGSLLASGGQAGTIHLWVLGETQAIEQGQSVKTLPGDNQVWVRSIDFSPDGSQLAAADEAGTIRIWDVRHRLLLDVLSRQQQTVWQVVFSPDGQSLASAGGDRTLRLWDLHSQQWEQAFRILQGHSTLVGALAFSPDGTTLAVGDDKGVIHLWPVEPDGTIKGDRQTLLGHSDQVCALAFMPDGQYITSGSLDDTVRIWQVTGGQSVEILEGHQQGVKSVAVQP